VGFTTGSRGKVPGKTCVKRIRNNNNNSEFKRKMGIKKDALTIST
jgi:hypothetical protein